MKWSVQQLNKLANKPYEFNLSLDYSTLAENVDDIISIDIVKVSGVIIKIENDTFQIKYHIEAPLVLQCALTLEPVNYIFSEDYDDIFSKIEGDEVFLIENNTIDLYEAVWSNIIIDKPLAVHHPNAYEILESRGIVLGEMPKLDEDEEIIYEDDGTKVNDNSNK